MRLTNQVTAKNRIRLDSLTGIRFAAALSVFLFHAGYYVHGGELQLFSAGRSGVSLFYILSGFVMAWVFTTGDRTGAFYLRRVARIYPAYFVAVTGAIAVSLIMRDFSLTKLFAYTLLQSWSPSPVIHDAASPVFWSLSCEAFFYLVFPLIAGRMSRASSRVLWMCVTSAALSTAFIGAIATIFSLDTMIWWFAYIFPLTRLLEFILGVALGFLVRRGFRLPIPVWAAYLLALSVVLIASIAPTGLQIAAITLIPFAVLIVSLAGRDIEGGCTAFSSRVLVKLGIWSYCFYLIHAMVQGWVVKATAQLAIPPLLALTLSLAASIAGAWLLHISVERGGERRFRPGKSSPRMDSDRVGMRISK